MTMVRPEMIYGLKGDTGGKDAGSRDEDAEVVLGLTLKEKNEK